jgi:hypothetical protein
MLYVDNMGLISESLEHILQDKEALSRFYQMTNLGEMGWILGIWITQDHEKGTLALFQEKFIKEILECYEMSNSHPISTPALPNEHLIKLASPEVDAKSYQYVLGALMLHSNTAPTFSSSSSDYTPLFDTPNTWDCIIIVSSFPEVVPAHPLDILPHVKPEPLTLRSLLHPPPYTSYRFITFHPFCTNGDDTELQLAPHPHLTHAHTLKHSSFCLECVCPTHCSYGGNHRAK